MQPDEETKAPSDNKPTPKNMANLEDLMAEYIANGDVNLDDNEKRLVDRQVFEKTGKHVGQFKNPKKSKPDYTIPVISSDGDNIGQKEGVPTNTKARKEPKIMPGVVVNGGIS